MRKSNTSKTSKKDSAASLAAPVLTTASSCSQSSSSNVLIPTPSARSIASVTGAFQFPSSASGSMIGSLEIPSSATGASFSVNGQYPQVTVSSSTTRGVAGLLPPGGCPVSVPHSMIGQVQSGLFVSMLYLSRVQYKCIIIFTR